MGNKPFTAPIFPVQFTYFYINFLLALFLDSFYFLFIKLNFFDFQVLFLSLIFSFESIGYLQKHFFQSGNTYSIGLYAQLFFLGIYFSKQPAELLHVVKGKLNRQLR